MVDPVILGAVTAVYIVVIMYLGYLGYKKTQEEEDFMVCGRKIHPVVLAFSYGATFISTSAIVGFGGMAAHLGMGLIWLTVLNIGVGIIIAFIIFGRRTRDIGCRLKAVTFPDLLGKCYRSGFMQSITGLIILVGMPLYTAAILISGARFIENTMAIQYDMALIGFVLIVAVYVIAGGLIAVMYSDALQGGIMMVGMVILLVSTYLILGGVETANADLVSLSPLVPSGLASAGHTGWASMPELGSPIWLNMITTIVLGVGIGVLAQPQLVVRFMTVKDSRSLDKAVFVGGPFILLMTGVAFTVGALTNVYFMREEGLLATEAAGGNIDSIIPMFINSSMPDAFVVVFMLALLAAAMSTLSSLFHTMGTSAGYDLWRNVRHLRFFSFLEANMSRLGRPLTIKGKELPKKNYRASQIGTGFMILVSIVIAYLMPGSIIARATAMFFGLCASAFLPAYAHALYSRKPSTWAAKASLAVGAVTWFTWTAFVHVAESAPLGISKFLFGEDAVLGMPWQNVDPLVISLPLSIAALAVALLIDRWRR
ncbi:MAG: sodium:solute symporter [Methanomassiliicoccales archaeon]